MAELQLTRGYVALVDDEDYQELSAYQWQALPRAAGNVYAKRRGKAGEAATVLLHRHIMGSPDGLDVDHLNHNTLDNRRANLRVVPHWVNLSNRRPWRWSR